MNHRIALDPEGRCFIWRDFLFRSTGFPSEWFEELYSEPVWHATKAWLRADERVQAAIAGETAELAKREAAAAGEELKQTFEQERRRKVAVLQEILHRGRVREALAWQGDDVLDVVDSFLSTRRHTREQLDEALECALEHLHRFCHQISAGGFYGPIAWGQCSEEAEAIELQVREPLVSRHEHFIEPWLLSSLRETMRSSPELRSYLPLRRIPSMALRDDGLRLPLSPPQPKTATEIALLRMCDGSVDSREAILALRERGLTTGRQAAELIDALERDGLLAPSSELPLSYRAEDALESWLASIPDELARAPRKQLAEVLEARARLTAACGDADAVREALLAAEALVPSAHEHGAVRRPIFQEAESNVSLALGASFLNELRTPLTVLHRVVHWYTQDLARRLVARASDALGTGPAKMELLQLQFQLLGEIPALAQASAAATRQRWEDASVPLLDLNGDPAAARRAVDHAFPEQETIWELARRFSPTLLFAAHDIESIRRGEYFAVLGGIQIAMNPLIQAMYTWVRDERELTEWTKQDSKRSSLIMDWEESVSTVRGVQPHDAYRVKWVVPHQRNFRWSNDSLVALAELFVERTESGAIHVRRRDSDETWTIPDTFNPALNIAATAAFRLCEEQRHCERVQIGKLVIERARWFIPKRDLSFLDVGDDAERFALVARWLRQERIPRYVTIAGGDSARPVVFDLHTPLSVDLFLAFLRGLPADSMLRIAEMQPTPDQFWLSDSLGNRYGAALSFLMTSD